MEKGKVIVTGGAGFIGSHIVRRLLELGYEVTVVDDLSTGTIRNIQEVLSDIEFAAGNVVDAPFLNKIIKGADYVIHQAAIASVPRSIKDPITAHKVNVEGTFNVLNAAREGGVRKVILASSSSVYGNRVKKGEPRKESLRNQPLSPYAVTKVMSEGYAKVFSHIYGLPTVSLRYFNVVGPRQNPDSEYAAVIPKYIKMILKGEQPIVYGDGKQTRDFTYVENIVDANIKAMESDKTIMGESINIACGKMIDLLQLLKHINKQVDGDNIKPIFEAPRPGEVLHSLADISKAKKFLGYTPLVSFEEGIKRTIESIKADLDGKTGAVLKRKKSGNK